MEQVSEGLTQDGALLARCVPQSTTLLRLGLRTPSAEGPPAVTMNEQDLHLK